MKELNLRNLHHSSLKNLNYVYPTNLLYKSLTLQSGLLHLYIASQPTDAHKPGVRKPYFRNMFK